MDAATLHDHIRDTFAGITIAENSGDTFFIYDPEGDLPPERTFPFATIVTGDHYDSVSGLDRPGAYRLNIGLTKATYSALFGDAPTVRDENGVLTTEFDYSATDSLMPHPIYASQHWVSIVTPSAASREVLEPLLAEAYEFAVRKHTNQRARRTS